MKVPPKAGARHQFTEDQVVAITADINYCYIHLLDGKQLHQSRTLKWFAERWPNLVRIHKGALINREYIHTHGVNTGKKQNGYVVMKTSLRLEVSRRRLKEVILLVQPIKQP